MGFYYNDGRILDNYLKKCPSKEKQKARPLDVTEHAIIRSLWKLYKDFNYLIAELITIRQVLEYLNVAELRYLVSNLCRIIGSLMRQRGRSVAVKYTFMTVRPDKKELAEIKRFLTVAQGRLDYIRETVIPGNLQYTPIKEYLEIQQRQNFLEDLYAWFDDVSSMVDANKNHPERIKEYVEHIINVVCEAGKMDEYKSRIQKYIKLREEKEAKAKQEKAEQEQAKEQVLLTEGMMGFQRVFNRAIYSLKGDNRICMGAKAIEQKINQYGRNAVFVLCCSMHGGRYIYRYLGDDDELVTTFAKARAFEHAAALEAKNRMATQYPHKMFDIAEFPKTA